MSSLDPDKQQKVDALVAMGVDAALSQAALSQHHWDVQRASNAVFDGTVTIPRVPAAQPAAAPSSAESGSPKPISSYFVPQFPSSSDDHVLCVTGGFHHVLLLNPETLSARGYGDKGRISLSSSSSQQHKSPEARHPPSMIGGVPAQLNRVVSICGHAEVIATTQRDSYLGSQPVRLFRPFSPLSGQYSPERDQRVGPVFGKQLPSHRSPSMACCSIGSEEPHLDARSLLVTADQKGSGFVWDLTAAVSETDYSGDTAPVQVLPESNLSKWARAIIHVHQWDATFVAGEMRCSRFLGTDPFRPAGSFAAHSDWIEGLAADVELSYVVTSSLDSTLRFWPKDASSQDQMMNEAKLKSQGFPVCVVPEKNLIVVAEYKGFVEVFDRRKLSSAVREFTAHQGCVGKYVWAMERIGEDRFVTGAACGTVVSWNTAGKILASHVVRPLDDQGQSSEVYGLCLAGGEDGLSSHERKEEQERITYLLSLEGFTAKLPFRSRSLFGFISVLQ